MVGMETRKRRWGWKWWLLAYAAMALVGFGLYWRIESTREARAAWHAYQRIQFGMREPDVRAILGEPSEVQQIPVRFRAKDRLLIWHRDSGGKIVIFFDAPSGGVGAQGWTDESEWQSLERRLFW
jgi:hypothetical protein